MIRPYILLAGLTVASAFTAMPVAARDITLDDAVRMGLESSPDLRMNRAEIDRSGAEESGSIGRIGPRLSLESQVFYWDSATDIEIEMPTELVDLVKPLLPAGQSLEFPPMKVQDRLTGEVVLMAAQPLSPLYSLANAYLARRASRRAAEHDLEASRNTVRHNVTEAFFRLRSIRAMVDVAREGVKQVEAHLETARKFHSAGFVGMDDVLRAETALAGVRNQLNRAISGERLARAALNIAVGLPPGDDINPAGDYPNDPPDPAGTLDEHVRAAIDNRPELAAVRDRVEASTAGYRARIGSLLPTLSAVFRYSHQEGNYFLHADSYFVGGTLEWNFWQLGDDWFRMKAAEATRDKALAGLQKAMNLITLDVTRAWTDLDGSLSSIRANRKAIESASENLRVVTKRYEAGSATSVEVLDAQGSLNRAKADFQVALFQYYTARSNLQRAVGKGSSDPAGLGSSSIVDR